MSAFLLATVFFVGFDDAKAAGPNLDGKWLIVYAEEGGRRNNSWEQQQATVAGPKLSYEAGGKQHSFTLKFGEHQTVTGHGESLEGGPWNGVYVASQDYFVLSLNRGGGGKAVAPVKSDKKDDAGTSSGGFILILRKQR